MKTITPFYVFFSISLTLTQAGLCSARKDDVVRTTDFRPGWDSVAPSYRLPTRVGLCGVPTDFQPGGDSVGRLYPEKQTAL